MESSQRDPSFSLGSCKTRCFCVRWHLDLWPSHDAITGKKGLLVLLFLNLFNRAVIAFRSPILNQCSSLAKRKLVCLRIFCDNGSAQVYKPPKGNCCQPWGGPEHPGAHDIISIKTELIQVCSNPEGYSGPLVTAVSWLFRAPEEACPKSILLCISWSTSPVLSIFIEQIQLPMGRTLSPL